MKKKILIFSLASFCAFSTFAQKSNSVRTNLTIGLALGDYNATYEKKLTNKLSVSTRTNFMSRTGIPFGSVFGLDTLNRQFDNLITDISQVNITAGGVRPEFRFHPKGEGLSGGYISIFTSAQFGKLSPIEGKFKRTNSNGDEVTSIASFAPSFSHVGGGIAFGKQWVFGSGVTIDLTFISLGFGVNKLKALGTASDMNEADYENYAKDISNKMISVAGLGPNVSSSADGVLVSLSTFSVVPRILQFGIGFSF
ncbi:MAG: DUF3575 domain-containing protein [Bacteroidetes bacterium]|nr:DUF3575 domain-containing protein [Bacteroidota bacterium]